MVSEVTPADHRRKRGRRQRPAKQCQTTTRRASHQAPRKENPSDMASFQIALPEPFSFATPNDWPAWKRQFLRSRTASGLDAKPEKSQVDAWVYLMGPQAEDIFKTFKLEPDDKETFEAMNMKVTLFLDGTSFMRGSCLTPEHNKTANPSRISLPGCTRLLLRVTTGSCVKI
ncbi:hypothetical protein MTO96_001191 [Rhipicephalus appendiculatus]